MYIHLDKGVLLVLEGLSNAGKTSLCKSVSKELVKRGIEFDAFFELTSPAGIVLDNLFRTNKYMSPVLKALLFAVDRRYLCENGLEMQLQNGKNVIIDRYYYTNFVNRSLEGLDNQWLWELEINNPRPDLTIFIDISPQESLARAKSLKKPTPYPIEFLNNARKKYLQYVETGEMKMVDGMAALAIVKDRIINIIIEYLRFMNSNSS